MLRGVGCAGTTCSASLARRQVWKEAVPAPKILAPQKAIGSFGFRLVACAGQTLFRSEILDRLSLFAERTLFLR